MMTLMLTVLLAVSPVDTYNQGNKFYQQGNYPAAIEEYGKALVEINSSELFYNLGNAYFKSGQIGKAIANYRRASFSDPRDADITNNLMYARNYRVDKILVNQGPIDRLFEKSFRWFSYIEAFWFSYISLAISTLFLSFYIISRKARILLVVVVSGLALVYFITTYSVWQNEKASHPAVVVTPEVNAFSGPGEEYKQILLLHDGTEVLIREKRGGFALVQISGGAGGWLRTENLENIY